MKKTICFAIRSALSAAVLVALTGSDASAQCCSRIVGGSGQEFRLEYSTVSEPVQQTSYKKVVETQFVDEEVTTYETVWETQQRERRYTVARTVPETTVTQRRYTVNKPVEETEMRDTSYNVTRLVPETTEREERYLVSKQVLETQQREVLETRKVPVQETTLLERAYTVSKPITTFNTQTVDRGYYVDSVTESPGRTYHRLAWQRAGRFYDPESGASRWHLPGLFWTPMQGETRYSVSKVYQPNLVTETVPVTTLVPEQRIEQVPVTRTTFRDETVSRIEEVQVPRTVQEEVVRKVPVTTYKQVVERVEQTTPVKVQRFVTEERVEEVPVTTYKTVTEERSEPYEVKVARVVPVKRTVRKPVTVEKWVPYTYTIERKRTVVNRIPIDPVVTVIERSPAVPISTTSTALGSNERIIGEVVDRAMPTPIVRSVAKPAQQPTTIETKELPTERLNDSKSTYKKTDATDPADQTPVIDK